MNYCSHCGSDNVEVVLSPNAGYNMYVAEESECATECYDGDIEMLNCIDCNERTYKSASLAEKSKTTRIGPSDLNYPQAPQKGCAPVQWLIDGEWVHKGWLLPQVEIK